MNLKLIGKKDEAIGVETFVFEAEKPFSWQPGQYLHYVLPHDNPDNRGIERWFTISSPPFSNSPSITTRYFGSQSSSFKQALFKLKIGDKIKADGPEGDFILDEKASQHVFIVGGIGITPFYSMTAQLDHDKKDLNINLLYLNRDENIVFKDYFAGLSKKLGNFKLVNYIDQLISTKDLAKYSEDNTVFYLSGPRKMVESYQIILRDLGIKKRYIKMDYFPGY